jgi:NDP-sugar pyrophosphorylase family protein
MVPVAGRPFLEYLLQYLRRAGLGRAVLCVGHRAELIREHFGSGASVGMELVYSTEEQLAGTGGALKLGAAMTSDFPVLALNGDSFAEVDLAAMRHFHGERRAQLTIALTAANDISRFGAVQVDPVNGGIVAFGEKSRSGPGLINAGVYLIGRDVVAQIPEGVTSFERDVLPRWVGKGAYGFVSHGLFLDIGMPEDYRRLAAAPGALLAAVAAGGPAE